MTVGENLHMMKNLVGGVTSTCQTVSYPEYTEVCNWVDDGSDGDWPPGEGGGGGYNPPTNPPDIPADKKPIDYIKRDDDHMAKKIFLLR